MRQTLETAGMSVRNHAGSGNDLGHLGLNDTNELSSVLHGLLSQYGLNLETEHHHNQQMIMSTSSMLSGEPPFVSSCSANLGSTYSNVLPRNVNQLDPTYSPLQRGPSGMSDSPYTIPRGGSGNSNDSPYAAIPRRVSTTNSPYSMVPSGASSSPYSDLSRASGSHDSPYAVSQEDGSPYSSRCSSTVGASSDAYLVVPNGANAPNGQYSTVLGNRSVPQNDPYNFQLASNGTYMKVPNSGMFSGRQDQYGGSYQGMSKEVSDRGNHDIMYPSSLGGSYVPYSGGRSDQQYVDVESGASYSSVSSGVLAPCGSPYMRLPVENKSNDNSYVNILGGSNSVQYSRNGNRYGRSGSHDGSYGSGGTSTHEGNYVASCHDIPSNGPSQSNSSNSFNHDPSLNTLYNSNSGHYGSTDISDRASANGAYSSSYSNRNINLSTVNSQVFEGATVNNMLEMVASHSFNNGSQPEQAFRQSDSFIVGQSKHLEFQSVNCAGLQNNGCKVSSSPSVGCVLQSHDHEGSGCSTAEHSFQVNECNEEGPPMSQQSNMDSHLNSEEGTKGLLVHHGKVMNTSLAVNSHSDDEIEDDFNWDRLL